MAPDPKADALRARIANVSLADQHDLGRLLRKAGQRQRRGQPATVLQEKLERRLDAAEALVDKRRAATYTLKYPPELPVSQAHDEILSVLKAHRTMVVCGDTGSGKTTQLPKLCLEAGRGILGTIGHTQPRRIAARSVANRLAEELEVPLGGAVGYQVRFTDQSNPASLIKLMTDGILLNEIRHDRYLLRYDTLIIDEAHERSLNIDFLLGVLKQLQAEREDLKLIVTSATIDPERFAAHFDDAPIIRVEGRSYPVDVRYRPVARGGDLTQAVVAAADGLVRHRGLGTDVGAASFGAEAEVAAGSKAVDAFRDVLVFLPGERWIRDAEQGLSRRAGGAYDVLPLYARLPASRQQQVFHPGRKPRVVLATNVAETSVTVPRIRYVVDTGLARISRYSTRHRMQSLAVEPIARANAVQRAGRCGRLGPGVCVRLFAEDDFDERPEFMDPEILRTDLAGVILRLESLGLGHVDDFPFIDAPSDKAVNDAYRLLHLLGAVDGERKLTGDGRQMARLPLDPRLARLLLVAERNGMLREGLVLASALSVIDPREQPPEQRTEARERHAGFNDPRSDFLTYLNLWQEYQHERQQGRKVFRDWCKQNFLSPGRFIEWSDVHHQLKELVLELGWRIRPTDDTRSRKARYVGLHRAVLAGFLDFVAEHDEKQTYRGTRQSTANLFPGSGLRKRHPHWIVAAERVATERVYLRTAAEVQPKWIMQAAAHLLERAYHDPQWDPKRGCVTAREIVKFHGLVLGRNRRVDFGRIDPSAARAIFIREALVVELLAAEPEPIRKNRQLRDRLLAWESRRRSRDLFAGEPACEAFYTSRLPSHITDRRTLERWLTDPAHAHQLEMAVLDIATQDPANFNDEDYPLSMQVAEHELPLGYIFDTAHEADGVTLNVPMPLLATLRPEPLEWLVPGWLANKVTLLLRALPKATRRHLVPLPDTVSELLPRLAEQRGIEHLSLALARVLQAHFHLQVGAGELDEQALPDEYRMRIAVLDERGAVVAAGRDLAALQRRFAKDQLQRRNMLSGTPSAAVGHGAKMPGADPGFPRIDLKAWDVGTLPDSVLVEDFGMELALYPALVDAGGRVDLVLLPPGPAAVKQHRAGVRRLLINRLQQQASVLRRRVLKDRALVLSWHGLGHADELVNDLECAAADEVFSLDPPVRTQRAMSQCFDEGRAEWVQATERLVELARDVLSRYRSLSRRLERSGDHFPDEAVNDIDAQLAALIHPGFLSATPPQWRSRLPRYLDAVAIRLDKLDQRHPKDAEYQAAIERATKRLELWQRDQPPQHPWPEPVRDYRWLLEEFRISLFAQQLGTRQPVSAKRLEAAWDNAVHREQRP